MGAKIIDGKALAARLRAGWRGGGRACGAARAGARPRGGAGGRRPGERGLRAQQGAARARWGCTRGAPAGRGDARGGAARARGRLNRDPRGARHPGAAAAAEHIARRGCWTPWSREGRGRLPPRTSGGWPPGRPALVPCTPPGCLMLCATGSATSPGRGGRGRADEHRRQADGAAAAARERTVTVAIRARATCRRSAPRGRRPGRGGRAAGAGQGDWVKPGAMVIDVGINRPRTASALVGDVDFDAARRRRRDHPGARGRRADDHRLLLANTLTAALPHARPAGAGRPRALI